MPGFHPGPGYGRTCKGCVRGCKFVMFHASSISVRWKCRGWRRGEENRKASASGPAAAPWFLDASVPARSGQRQRKEKNSQCPNLPASPVQGSTGHRMASVGLLIASPAPAQAALTRHPLHWGSGDGPEAPPVADEAREPSRKRPVSRAAATPGKRNAATVKPLLSPWRFFHGSTAILKVNCPKGERNRSGPFPGKKPGLNLRPRAGAARRFPAAKPRSSPVPPEGGNPPSPGGGPPSPVRGGRTPSVRRQRTLSTVPPREPPSVFLRSLSR